MVINHQKLLEKKNINKNSLKNHPSNSHSYTGFSPASFSEQGSMVDEGWWESIMSEEEAIDHPYQTNQAMKPGEQNHRSTAVLPYEPVEIDWDRACLLYENDQALSMQVVGYNRGGLLVNGEQLQGFVPVSHLVDMPCSNTDSEEWLSTYVERPLFLKIIECDPERGRIVLSERAALSEPGSRIHLLNRIKPGDCITGIITNITDFGVFVDLGGVEGLIHVSEISWGRVHHPSDVVQLDQRVEVYVLQVDRERARVGLSMKRLYPNPWETAEERYSPGQIVEAVVTSIVPFGAFARLEEGLDGLIHISEMNSESQAEANYQNLMVGHAIKARVLHVDCERQRLGLSLHL